MLSHSEILNQIRELISRLIESGLSDDQNFPFEKMLSKDTFSVTFPGSEHTSIAMKDTSYNELYDRLKEERAYVIRMADGSLIQMMYLFKNGELLQHRLAFFPSPYLEEFQNDPEIYLEDEIYADIISKKIVPFPIRYDYDVRDGVFKELEHPKSHLTLGQYTNCRIPVSSPLAPTQFIDFVLRNFYHTAHTKYCDILDIHSKKTFKKCISDVELNVIHVSVPEI
jgi:hypothetical protein